MSKRIGFHTHYFRATPLESNLSEIAKIIHDAGGRTLECLPAEIFAMDSAAQKAMARTLSDLDVELIVGAGRGPQNDPTNPDPAVQKAALDLGREMLPRLCDLGCHKWDGMIHASWLVRPEGVFYQSDKDAIMKRSADNVRQLMDLADTYDIDFCFEIVNRFEHYLFNTAQEGVTYCSLIDHPRAKLLLDTFHMNIEEDSICDAIVHAAEHQRLGHFHIGEANRSIPGTRPSHMDWKAIFDTLAQVNYDGSIIIEPFMRPASLSASSVSLWRDLTEGASWETYCSWVETGITYTKQFWHD